MNATTEPAAELAAPLKSDQDLQRVVDQVDAVVADLRKALGLQAAHARRPCSRRNEKN